MNDNSDARKNHFGILLARHDEDGKKVIINKKILYNYAKYGSYASYHLRKFKFYDAYAPLYFVKYKDMNINLSTVIKQINILRKKYIGFHDIMEELDYVHTLFVKAKAMDNYFICITPYPYDDSRFTPGAVIFGSKNMCLSTSNDNKNATI